LHFDACHILIVIELVSRGHRRTDKNMLNPLRQFINTKMLANIPTLNLGNKETSFFIQCKTYTLYTRPEVILQQP